MKKNEGKYFYTASLMNQALLDLFEKKDIEYVEGTEIEFDRTDFDGERTRVIIPNKVQ